MTDQSIRLSKRMAELGMCSRSEADRLIEQGLVKVDGVVVQALGSRVMPDQQVELAGALERLAESSVSLLLYRADGAAADFAALCRADNQSAGDASEMHWRPRPWHKLQAAGALGDGECGLIALTQDRTQTKRLAVCEAEYLVQVASAPPLAQLQADFAAAKLPRGAKISRQSDRQVRLVLPAQLRGLSAAELCRQAGLLPLSVRCSRIGRLATGDLKPDNWRYLLPVERF